MISLLFNLVASQQTISYPPWPASQQQFPPNCNNQSTFPDSNEAARTNYNDPNRPADPCAPLGPRPAIGQQVYIQDPINFCINLPNPNAGAIADIYKAGKRPTILEGEGYLQSFCLGDHLSPGAFPLPTGAITAAHVLTGTINRQKYIQISGVFNCDALKLTCTSPDFSDGGQYDTAPFRNFGKSPYSGVDASKNPNMPVYNMQAGNGIFCMRVCEAGPSGGMQEEDPCNVKFDTRGCFATMNNPSFAPGFDMDGKTFPTPPQLAPSPNSTSGGATGGGSGTSGSSNTTTGSGKSSAIASSFSLGLLLGAAALM